MKSISQIRKAMRITKIVATRSIKTKTGDTYTGFTASWDSVQDDDPSGEPPSMPLTLNEGRIAHLLLAMETDIASYTSAIANGSVGLEEGQNIIIGIQQRYQHIIQQNYKENSNDNT